MPIQPGFASAETFPYLGTAAESSISIHKGAMKDYPLAGKVSSQDPIIVLSQFTNSSNETWLRIQNGDVTGWVMNSQVKKSDKPAPFGFIANSEATIHWGAMRTYNVTAEPAANTMVEVLDVFVNQDSEIWYKVKTDTVTGWILNENLNFKPEPYEAFNQSKGQLVKRGASETERTVHTLQADEKVKIIDFFISKSNEPWYRLELTNGVMGWTKAAELKTTLSAKPSSLPEISSVYAKMNPTLIREGAMSHYTVRFSAKQNSELSVVGTFKNNLNENWYRVEYQTGKYGWVNNAHTSNAPAINGTFYVQVAAANVRSGASTSEKVVATLTKGAAVKVVDQFINKSSEKWYRVQLGTNSFGWVSASLLSEKAVPLNTSMYINSLNAELRRGAEFGERVTEKVPYSSKVTIKSQFINKAGETWVNIVTPKGNTGWIPEWELIKSLTDRKIVSVKSEDYLRKSAAADGKWAATIKPGDPVAVLREFNGWYNAENARGVRGWIDASKTSVYVPSNLMNPVAKELTGGGTELMWPKSKSTKISFDFLAGNTVYINTKGLGMSVPDQYPDGIKSISSDSSSMKVTPAPGYFITVHDKKDRFQLLIHPIGVKGKTVVLDAGHGGSDTGAIGPTKLYEKDVTFAVTNYLGSILKEQGAYVLYTRTTDFKAPLSNRFNLSNASDADIFISIHANANTSRTPKGTETYFNVTTNPNGDKSKELSQNIQRELVKQLGTTNRGIKEAGYQVIKYNEIPSALVELAFISNYAEEKMLRSDIARRKAAQGIFNGIEDYFQGGY